MTRSAARVDSRLVAALARIDDPALPMAETCRRIGLVADELAVPRPQHSAMFGQRASSQIVCS